MTVRCKMLKMDEIIMKHVSTVLIFCPLVSFAAKIVELPLLPEGALPNSEVVTNIVLDVNADRIDTCVEMREYGQAKNMVKYQHL